MADKDPAVADSCPRSTTSFLSHKTHFQPLGNASYSAPISRLDVINSNFNFDSCIFRQLNAECHWIERRGRSFLTLAHSMKPS